MALTRREAIGAAAAGYASVALGYPTFASGRRRPLLRDGSFKSGVASGDPRMDGITLWTRLHDVDRGGRIGVEVAHDDAFERVVHRDVAEVVEGRDFTAVANIRGSRRLRPGETYWYRFYTRDSESPAGRFRTLRPPDSRETVRVAFYSCQDYEQGFFTAHDGLAAERDIDLVVCMGDYVYERAGAEPRVRLDRTGTNGDGGAQSLADYREKYRLYRSDRALQATHAAHPHLAFWDSHDIESQGTAEHPDTDQYGALRRVSHRARLLAGKRAFVENMPQSAPADERFRMYRSLSLGAHADLLLTDEQRYHDPYPCPFVFPPRPCPEAENPARRYLGKEQLGWLLRKLDSSRATWKLFSGGAMMMGLELLGSPFNPGQWDGYVAERRRIMEHILGAGIENVVRMSGDIHTFFAGQVTTTGDSGGKPAATEFIGSSISSFGIPEGIRGGSGGAVDPRLAAALSEQLPLVNPHLAYTEQRHRGYCVIECRSDEATVEFRSPRTALEPSSEMFTLERFRVPAGAPVVERA